MRDLSRSLGDRVKGLIGRNELASGKGFDVQPAGGGQTHAVREMHGDIVKQQPLGPGHDHFPADVLIRGLELHTFGDVVALVGAELATFFSGIGQCRDKRQNEQ